MTELLSGFLSLVALFSLRCLLPLIVTAGIVALLKRLTPSKSTSDAEQH